jgi:prepilin-type processing-associated H-X9-DG protein
MRRALRFIYALQQKYDDPLAAWDYRFIMQELSLIWAEWEDQRYVKVGDQYAYGSYGKNVYVSSADMVEAEGEGLWWYRNIRVKGVSQIPVHGDCNYTGAFPEAYNEPAEFRLHGPVDGENINRWNLDRHSLSVNFVFLDWSVRKLGLRQLWAQKWSKQTVNQGGRPVSAWGNLNVVPDWNDPSQWPEWMQLSKNFDL